MGDAPGSDQLDSAKRYLDEGLTDSALAAFGLALEENPRLVEAQIGMADIYTERGEEARGKDKQFANLQFEMARKRYEKATKLKPDSFHAHYNLGKVLHYLDRVKEAIRSYLIALAIDPNDFDANNRIATAYVQLGQFEQALPYVRKAAKLQPSNQGALGNLAEVYRKLGMHKEAVAAYRDAMELGELEPVLMMGLARSHLKLDHYEQAENTLGYTIHVLDKKGADADKALKLAARERMGYAKFKQRRFAEALKMFNAALEVDGEDPASLNGRGACLLTLYLHGGRKDKKLHEQAMDAFRKSLRIKPDQPKIVDLYARYRRM